MSALRLADSGIQRNQYSTHPYGFWAGGYRCCWLAGLICWLAVCAHSIQGQPLPQNPAALQAIPNSLGNTAQPALNPIDAGVNEPAHRYRLGDPAWEQALAQIFADHWRSTDQDPATLDEDLQILARYFSAYPQVRQLLRGLHGLAWELRYTPATFKTEVRGNHLQVHSVRVHFDSRTAAQFRFQQACSEKRPYCVASPADVLLHELIHAHIILTQPHSFIAQGGLDRALYPHQHEQEAIAQEATLYQAMTELDQQPRPLRTEHTGRSLPVSCITCVR